MPLLYGDFETLYLSDMQYAYCRTYFDQVVVVVMNKGDSEEKINFGLPARFNEVSLEGQFGFPAENFNGKFEVTLEAGSFEIYTAKLNNTEK